MQHTKQVLDWDNRNIFKNKRTFTLDEDLVDKIDSIEYGAQVNVIEEIQVNWVPQEPDPAKAVNIHVPRVINALTSDSEEDALSAKMWKYLYSLFQQTGVLYRYRWSVATFDDLPESWNQQWDVYNILDTGMNYAWTWTEWDALWWSIYTAWYWIEISDTNVISAVRQPDHYLWHWNCIEWQSPDFLETAPYDYNAWDYYIVNKTADMSWTKRIEMLWGEYHIPSYEEMDNLLNYCYFIIEDIRWRSAKKGDTKSNEEYTWDPITVLAETIWIAPWQCRWDWTLFDDIHQSVEWNYWWLWLSDWVLFFSSEERRWDYDYEFNIYDSSDSGFTYPERSIYILQVRAFKDEPVIPDSTWTQVVDWSETCRIPWTWIYKKESLWLITFVFPWWDEDLWEPTDDIWYVTIKDKNEWATTFWWIWYWYQWWNCNWFEMPNYEVDSESTIDFDWVTPSTYSSNTFIASLDDQYTNSDDAWWSITDTDTAKRWPCPEWWHVPTDAEVDFWFMALIAYSAWKTWMDFEEAWYYIWNEYDIILSLLDCDNYKNNGLWHILPVKNTPVVPPSDLSWWWVLLGNFNTWWWWWWNVSMKSSTRDWNLDSISFLHNEEQEIFSVVLIGSWDILWTYTFADKLLWATEIFDIASGAISNYSIKIWLINVWYTYQWWNNYPFNLNPATFEEIFDTQNITYQTIYNSRPYNYNWNIIMVVPTSWPIKWSISNILKINKEKDIKAAPSENPYWTYWINRSLWNYVDPTHNLRPKWTSYVEDPTTDSEIENERVDINDIYLYDWTQWILMDNHIVPHVFVTQTEYNGISDKKYHNWTLYLFVDKHPWDPENPCDNLWEYEQFKELALWEDYDPGVIKSTRDVTIHDSAPQRAQAICDRLNWCLSGYRSKFYWDSDYHNDHFIHTSWWYLFWEIGTWWTTTTLEVYDASTWYVYYFISQNEQWTWEVESYHSWWDSAV